MFYLEQRRRTFLEHAKVDEGGSRLSFCHLPGAGQEGSGRTGVPCWPCRWMLGGSPTAGRAWAPGAVCLCRLPPGTRGHTRVSQKPMNDTLGQVTAVSSCSPCLEFLLLWIHSGFSMTSSVRGRIKVTGEQGNQEAQG